MRTKQTITIIGATGNMGAALAKSLSKRNIGEHAALIDPAKPELQLQPAGRLEYLI